MTNLRLIKGGKTSNLPPAKKTKSDNKTYTLNKILTAELAIKQISKLLRGDEDLDERLTKLCKILANQLKADAASINLLVKDGRKKAFHADGSLADEELEFVYTTEGFEDISAMTETGAYIDDLPELPLLNTGLNVAIGALPRSAAICGIYAKGKWIGYIAVMDFSPGRKWNNIDEHIVTETVEELRLARERHETLESLKEANEAATKKAEELQKALMREKELNALQAEFIATASHEFKTPLTIIDSSAQLLKSDMASDANYLSRQVEKIRNAVKRMSYLVEKTLDLSTAEAGSISFEPKQVNITALLTEVCGRFHETYPDRQIIATAPSDELIINADEKLLDQVLSNIIGNALKYSSPESEITVKLVAEGRNAAIYICDEGIGIHQDDLARMFGKFTRGRNTTHTPGTGIGLYISEKFIRMMGGYIWVSSEMDKGTLVKITLPAAF